MPDHSDEHCPGRAACLSQSRTGYTNTNVLRTSTHGYLVDLPTTERRSLKSLINEHHDPLTRLPPEMISEIFKFYCMDSSSPFSCNKLPLIIGEVCKHWRNVTLETPQLWSTIIISAHADRVYDIDVASEWLSRSRSLPLSLDITFLGQCFTDTVYLEKTTLSPLICLLRSHSARWENITADATCCQSGLFLPLFRDLKNLPTNLETFETYTDVCDVDKVLEHNMFPLLLPRKLNAFGGSSTVGLPIGWDRLTSLEVSKSMYLDEFLHIIGHAPNLLDCSVTSVCDARAGSNLANTLMTSRSLTTLIIQSSSGPEDDSDRVLPYLALPSLKILRYTDLCYHPTSDADFEILKSFLERSSPKLDEFSFSITPPKGSSTHIDYWYKEIPSITYLELDLTLIEGSSLEDEATLTDDFFSLVFNTLHSTGFPRLQCIALSILSPTAQFWEKVYSLCQKLPPIRDAPAQTLSTEETSPRAPNSLKYLKVEWIYHPNDEAPKVSMEPGVLFGLLDIEKKSGVQILVGDENSSYPLSKATNVRPPTAL